jgi:hypothetical protein
MKMMMVCLLTLLGVSTAKSQTLVLWHANGTTTDVELYTQPQVKFENDKVLITSTVLDMEFPKQDVLRFTYKGGTLGISSPRGKADVSQENGQLVFHGIKSSDKIAVYNTKGIRVPIKLQHSGSTATLPLSAIHSGVYLLNVNGRTSKFTKR